MSRAAHQKNDDRPPTLSLGLGSYSVERRVSGPNELANVSCEETDLHCNDAKLNFNSGSHCIYGVKNQSVAGGPPIRPGVMSLDHTKLAFHARLHRVPILMGLAFCICYGQSVIAPSV